MTGGDAVGFIGLGAMGGPMARNAAESGLRVLVFDKSDQSLQRAAGWGGIACSSVADMARQAQLIVTVLPADRHVVGVLTGEDGILTVENPPEVLDFSTIGPWTYSAMGEIAREKGSHLYAGALTKGVDAAEAGRLALYLDDEVREHPLAMKVVEAISDSASYTGIAGTAKAVKLLNNLVVGVNVALLAEALSVGAKAGIEPAALLEALERGSSRSFAMSSHFRTHALAKDLGPGRFSTEYILKDLRLAAEMARRHGLTTFFGSLASAFYRGANALGHAGDYYPAVWDWTDVIAGNPRQDLTGATS